MKVGFIITANGSEYGIGFLRIWNAKLNYMTVKELLIKFQEYQLEYKVLNANCAHNAAANLFMERYGVKNCSIPVVVRQKEQLVCCCNVNMTNEYHKGKCIKCKKPVAN